MTVLLATAIFVAVCLSLEITIRFIVHHFRKEFQWLITDIDDETPRFDQELVAKYIDKSFDPALGWSRRPNTSGVEKGISGPVTYTIDSLGSRTLNEFDNTHSFISTFGDSYTFCRQVNDTETWQYELSNKIRAKVLNFGVGNYGLDQALMRYEKTELPKSTRVVVMGIVPETLCRVHSYWKHYSEFGNILAFKPRFILNRSGLDVIENAVKCENDFYHYTDKIHAIQSLDGFYRQKFQSYQFRNSYLLSFSRHPLRNTLLLCLLLKRKICRTLGCSNPTIENAPFAVVMKTNISYSMQMYKDERSCNLLTAIALRFKQEAERRGHLPVLLVMPQFLDLRTATHGKLYYQNYFESLNKHLDVLDVTDEIQRRNYRDLYVEDSYGGHFSPTGNAVIAELLSEHINRILSSSS